MINQRKWWKEAVIYQIYPRSFYDSNGDGIGDIQGIIKKLEYLKELGVDVIWLSPCYESPNEDNGYDISDYKSIMKEYGTFDDWERLLDEIHARGMKLLMDLVVNHTSDKHQWFEESRKSKSNPYRDYYIWKQGKENSEPNDWESFFSGSTWEYDEATKEYYLHLFSKKQPDLNWENEKVRTEVYDMMTWWLDKGIDGFRMDVINLISKVKGLPSVKHEAGYRWGGEFFMNGPKVHEYLKEMNDEVLSKYDIMTVGETVGVSVDEAIQYSSEDSRELNMVFQFELMDIDSGENGKWGDNAWKLSDFKSIISKWQIGLADKGWNSLYLNNHDQPRMVSRFGNDELYRVQSAKMLATMLHTLQGTPYIYQGEELGMTNIKYENIEDYNDIETLNIYNEYISLGYSHDTIMEWIYHSSRDNARTPMQWNNNDNGGFTTGTPWLKVNPNFTVINAEKAASDGNSIFHYYKKLISLRKKYPIMAYGSYEEFNEDNERIFSYTRRLDGLEWFVTLNFSKDNVEFLLPENFDENDYKVLISNYTSNNIDSCIINLKPYECVVFQKSK